jgi:hypothetical protein
MATRTSRVWDCWQALWELIVRVHGTGLQIEFGDPGKDVQYEVIAVPGTIEGPANGQEWATMGQRSKDELFGLQVVFVAGVQGQSSLEARDRLRELMDPVEAELRTMVGQQPAQGVQLGVDGVVWAAVASVSPTVFLGDEGFVGYGEMTVVVKARI